jgi:hypothetical protein
VDSLPLALNTRFGGNRDHSAAAHHGSGALDGSFARTLGIDLDQVGRHDCFSVALMWC